MNEPQIERLFELLERIAVAVEAIVANLPNPLDVADHNQ
jgi:hypothetical protein